MAIPSPITLDQDDGLPIGHTLGGKYTIERLIGRGGMAHVYLATAGEDGQRREVVVKMIAPRLSKQSQTVARFEREAKRLDELRHSNIVEMYDYGREDGRSYIVMEWVDGELLSDYLDRKGRLTLAEFVPIAAQILKGFGHAHSRDLMIRDIKPANVMLCERKGRANFVKIIDFGLAKMLEGEENITKQHVIGTSGYLSPEQIEGRPIDLRVDVYALGVLFYQMLAGRMPFEAENETTLLYKHVHDDPTPLAEVLPEDREIPDELVALIQDCIRKNPDERPADANEIVERMIDCVPMSMFKLPPSTGADRSARPSSRPHPPTAEMLRDLLGTVDSGAVAVEPEAEASTTSMAAAPTSRSKAVWLLGGAVAALALAIGATTFTGSKTQRDESPAPELAAALEPAASAEVEAPSTAALETGSIEINSHPAADLSIDGNPAGNTPYARSLPVGKHMLEIVADGYVPWTREVEIRAGANPPIDVKLVPLVAEGDSLSQQHEPSEARAGKRPTTTKPRSHGTKPKSEAKPEPEPEPVSKPEPKPEPAAAKPELEPKKPEKTNPFLPTSKKTEAGPFLPTEK